ncbi:MAG: hypothetical protein FJ403_20395 [Verrucomicrobia bacterium]|nr:hypothetical protein [Verrucomicrobiota bacterium]
MPNRWHNSIAAILLIFSIGGHWAVLQSGAWVGMFINFSQHDPVSEALVKTFDGNHPCRVCDFVAEGKKSEKKEGPQAVKMKIDFFLEESTQESWDPNWSDVDIKFASIAFEKTCSPPTPLPRFS